MFVRATLAALLVAGASAAGVDCGAGLPEFCVTPPNLPICDPGPVTDFVFSAVTPELSGFAILTGPTDATALSAEMTVEGACDLHFDFSSCSITEDFAVTVCINPDPLDCTSCEEIFTAPGGCANGSTGGSLASGIFVQIGGASKIIVTLEPVAPATTIANPTVGMSATVVSSQFTNANGVCGDPHFTRWQHDARDSFHGECDMVLAHSEDVNGQEFSVHTRTTIQDSFSYVEAAAMKYGNDVVEFQHDAIYVNGAKVEDESNIVFGEGNKITVVDANKRKFQVDIQGKAFVNVASMKQFMSVALVGTRALENSVGILGDFKTGDMIGREGQEFDNFEDFAFEWQVNPEVDGQLFMDARHPQLPYERCRMPSMSAEARRRKLRGGNRKLLQAATEACTKNHIPVNVQSCIDDVMFTGELELAEAF